MDILEFVGGPLLFGLGIWIVLGAWQSQLVRIAGQYDLSTRLKVAARWYLFGILPLVTAILGGTFMLSMIGASNLGGDINQRRIHVLLMIVLYVLAAYPGYARWLKASPIRVFHGYE